MESDARAKTILFDALDRPAERRAAFLNEACAGDAELRARVEQLLAAHGNAEGILGAEASPAFPTLEGLAAAIDLSVGDRIGPFVLEEELGSGGFGVVFRATQEEPVRRQVALKVVKLGMDTRSILGRFELECQALALMDHPNIARVFDAGVTDSGRPYFVMELVDGVAINEYCDREQLGVAERLRLFARVAKAVQHAHQQGVLHRDIKPGNVLVAEVDGEPQPKVIDFGIAKATGGQLTEASFQTHEGHLLGTPSYMSPEQIDGALDIDTRADVYSLGVLLYELISGAPPFDVSKMGLVGVFQSIREQDPPRPSTRRRQVLQTGEVTVEQARRLQRVPPELDWIVMRCLEKERARRYPTAHDLAADVERFLADEPLEAAPPGHWYRARKLVRRHRAAALAVAGIAIALLLGTIGTTVGLVRAERINVQLDGALRDTTRANESLDVALADANEANEQLDLALVDARRQAAIAEAVSDFLIQDLLGAARPTGEAGMGPATTIGELLDVAAAELDASSSAGGRFAAQPLVEADLRYTMGVAYDTLGRFTDAARHIERSVELRRDVADVDTVLAMSYLAMVRMRGGDYAQSADLQERAFELSKEVLGPDAVDTLRSAARLADSYRKVGRADDARELLEQTLPLAIESQGERAAVVTDLSASLAIHHADAGRYAESEELFRAVLDAQVELLGPESPVVLNTTMNLATLVRAQGKNDEAEAMYHDILAAQRRVEGPEHPHTLTTFFNLAECLADSDRVDEASGMLAETQSVVERAYGFTHPRAFLWLSTRARLLQQLGQPDEAARLLHEAHERARSQLGPQHATTLQAAFDLAQALARADDSLAEARELMRDVHDAHVRLLGGSHAFSLESAAALEALDARLAGTETDAVD